jgi:hypothetical protein
VAGINDSYAARGDGGGAYLSMGTEKKIIKLNSGSEVEPVGDGNLAD